ncbi:uncharacterized protein LOC109862403 isoform X2 [Pseudomyrmex gracilis]|uniref:uncharacterized protein LOC109862403 isoform X2 n=1 Tax=Pseudomyrmex gracilis TaxID=219809 RepID=UPI000995AFAF|nr:uncharacterized protein LOC109862403 isoform X2 [Pseudomyrmex gracilis]
MQKIKQWPLFESIKFMEKHIQRRRTFSNVSLQFGITLHTTPEKSNFSHQRENTASQSNQNMTQLFQELKRRQSTVQVNEGLKKVPSIVLQNRIESVIGKNSNTIRQIPLL